MEFTYQQTIAIMRILLDIIHADGIIDERETFFFNKLKKEFDLDNEAYEAVKSKNSLLALAQIKQLEEEQKTVFAKLMSAMIVVDDDINANEIAIYDIVAQFCNINVSFDETIDSTIITKCSKS